MLVQSLVSFALLARLNAVLGLDQAAKADCGEPWLEAGEGVGGCGLVDRQVGRESEEEVAGCAHTRRRVAALPTPLRSPIEKVYHSGL